MARMNAGTRELDVKIVYYGPALSGKTTNIVALHRRLDPERKTSLISVDTRDDRTLLFDLLPFDLGTVRGFRIRFRIYTVPGQVPYAATRKLVLAGADGVVQVMDSAPARASDNQKSLSDLMSNLAQNGIRSGTVPIVAQWNKRDLPDAVPLPDLSRSLRPHAFPELPAIATKGEGILETFTRVSELALTRLSERMNLVELGGVARDLGRRLKSLGPSDGEQPDALPPPGAKGAAPRRMVVKPEAGGAAAGAPGTGELLALAVTSAAKNAELVNEKERDTRRAEAERDELRVLHAVSERLQTAGIDVGMAFALRAALPVVRADAMAIVLPEADGSLEARALCDLAREPLLSVTGGSGAPLLAEIVAKGDPLHCEDLERELVFEQISDGARTYASGLVLPFPLCDGSRGALTAYSVDGDRPVRAEAQPFLRLLASQLSLVLEQRALHSAVEASREAWLATVDGLADPVYVIDRDYRLRRVNRAFALEVKEEPRALVGRPCHQVLFGRPTPCAQCFARPAMDLRTGAPPPPPVQIKRYLPGRIVEARAIPLPAGEEPPTTLLVLHDVTRVHAMTRHLIEAEKLASLGGLAAGMAHEINNPLGAISANVEFAVATLEDRPARGGGAEARQALGEARAAIDRVQRIVRDLRHYAGGDERSRSALDLARVARQSIQIAKGECRREDVSVELAPSASVRTIGYPMKLAAALKSIVKNAIEAAPPGSAVRLGIATRSGLARISVADRGAGIPESVRSRIFDPFFTTKRIGSHMGLSLAIAYVLVKGMGGTIEVDSIEGQGATFTIVLPLPREAERTARIPREMVAAVS